jgi:putative chitinase
MDLATLIRQEAPHGQPEAIAALVRGLQADKDVNTPLRQAHFLCHVIFEPVYLTHFVENLNYSVVNIKRFFPKLRLRAISLAHRPEAFGNAAYANHYGNGNEASGDGFRFRGRGFLQHTFKDNYKELSDHLGVDLIADPVKLSTDFDLMYLAASYYFVSRKCIEYADKDDIKGSTKRINGGLNGLVPRASLEDEIEVKMEVGKKIFTTLTS